METLGRMIYLGELCDLSNAPRQGELWGPTILVSLLFHGRIFAKSICLQDKWPFSRRRWQATQRWYWIDFWNVAELTVWCIRADMNHKNSIKKALEWLTAEYYFWWLIWLSHYGRGSSQIASYKIAFHSLLSTPASSLSLSLSLSFFLNLTLHTSSVRSKVRLTRLMRGTSVDTDAVATRKNTRANRKL